jgi:hypothetical protein
MVEQVEKTKRNFFFFNDGNFEVKNVEAFSCEGFPETWFVPGAGTCTIGSSIFEDISSVQKHARAILRQKENLLEELRLKVDLIK